MSEFHDTNADIVADREGFTSDPVRNLRTGLTFTAELEEVEPLVVQAELGEDAREVVSVNVTNPAEAALIRPNDFIEFRLLGVKYKYRIIKRRHNAASPQTKFWSMQFSEQDT